MFAGVFNSSLIHGGIPATIGVLSIVALAVIVCRRPVVRSSITFALAAAVGAALGFSLAWYLGDVRNLFGVTLPFSTRAWLAAGVAGVAVACVSLWGAQRWRVYTGIAGMVVFALMAAVGINATIGEYPTVADALGMSTLRPLHMSRHSASPSAENLALPLWQSWHAPANMPRRGTVGTVVIPAVSSHFAARPAIVYLPPAALTRASPQLPVLMFLGGQPGSPQTVVNAGQLPEIMDAFAAAHHGLAPIVIIPDQLGSSGANPMCIDSSLGAVATYLTVDVPRWVGAHLRVLSGRSNWAIGGFSEGGTCSIQLGTKYRSLFGSIRDVSGQISPLNRSIQHTVKVGFDGSRSAYRAESAPALLASGSPFSSTLGIFVVGQNDAKYGPETTVVEHAALAARMRVRTFRSPGTAHDWYTEQYGLRVGVPLLARQWGLTS